MTTQGKLMTADELLNLPDDGRFYELLDGVLVEVTPAGGMHGELMSNVSFLLSRHVRANELGNVLSGDPGIILRRNPDRVRAPDVCCFARGRLPGNRAPAGYLEVVPDLVVELISPSDTAANVQVKIEEWLRAGARLVWAFYPASRSLAPYHPDGSAHLYVETDTLDAAPVLPDFSARVADFFS